MNEPDNSIFFDNRICNPIDDPLERMKIVDSNVELDEGPNIDPLTTAAILLKSRAVRLEQFRAGEPVIDDISWHILLELMVSMNTGVPVTVNDLAITHDVAMNTMSRYVGYLIGIGLIDKNAAAEERGTLKLTESGDSLTGNALRKVSHELVNF